MSQSGQAPGHTCLSPPPPAAGGNASPPPRAEGSSLLTEISPYAKTFARAQGWTLLLCMEADMEPSLRHRGRKEVGCGGGPQALGPPSQNKSQPPSPTPVDMGHILEIPGNTPTPPAPLCVNPSQRVPML